jgi:uncharacterized protein with HEPN domain
MYDEELVREILSQILTALDIVLDRFSPVKTVDDFTSSPYGKEKLDALCMQLIAIGEALKNLDKVTNQLLLAKYPQINWKGAKAMRDIISHHYLDIDAEIIFEVCKNKIQPLRDTIRLMLDHI